VVITLYTALALLLSLPAAAFVAERVPPPPVPGLPDPVPDLVAMVKAQKPPEVMEIVKEDGDPEVADLYRRLQQGDLDEALRLLQELAAAHPGTPKACAALFQIARVLSRGRERNGATPEDLRRITAIACQHWLLGRFWLQLLVGSY